MILTALDAHRVLLFTQNKIKEVKSMSEEWIKGIFSDEADCEYKATKQPKS